MDMGMYAGCHFTRVIDWAHRTTGKPHRIVYHDDNFLFGTSDFNCCAFGFVNNKPWNLAQKLNRSQTGAFNIDLFGVLGAAASV